MTQDINTEITEPTLDNLTDEQRAASVATLDAKTHEEFIQDKAPEEVL